MHFVLDFAGTGSVLKIKLLSTRGYGDRSGQDATPLELDILVIVINLFVTVINVPDVLVEIPGFYQVPELKY